MKFFKRHWPPRDYFRYLYLLAGTLIAFAVLSFSGYTLQIGTLALKDSKIKQFFYPDTVPVAPKIDSSQITEKVDSSAQRFLFIGDSMLEFLRIRMNEYCKKNGHTMQTVIWYSSSSLWFGQCDTLKHFIKKYNPTYVVLVLGANELFIKDIKTERAKFVSNIIAQMGKLPFIWVGPPNWKDDTGINDLILQYAGESRYFPSKNLTYERTKDGAHPKRESAYKWMDSIAVYMQNDAAYKVLMTPPDTLYGKVPPTVILQPNPPF